MSLKVSMTKTYFMQLQTKIWHFSLQVLFLMI
jgi:hypothetical protein